MRATMKRAAVRCIAVALMLLAVAGIAEAQHPAKVFRLGYLSSAVTDSARVEAFRRGLRELGYVEGKSIVIEYRYSEGKLDRLPALAAELVRLKVDIIVTGAPSATRAAKEATVTIPIVMTNDADPVGAGFVASLARPGGNITGLANFNPELSGKRVELLKEIIPQLSRVAVLGTSTSPANAQLMRETELAAGAAGVKLQYVDILSPKDLETALKTAKQIGLIIPPNVLARADRVIK